MADNIDAIEEALLEIRFTGSVLPDLAVGRLSANPLWTSFIPTRLPIADIPLPIRQQDPSLAAQPTVELRAGDGTRIVKLGDEVISYHLTRPYPGWLNFRSELEEVTKFLFATMAGATATRIGLRYINLFTAADHKIDGMDDLKLEVNVGGEKLMSPYLLSYTTKASADLSVTVKVGAKDFILNPSKAHASAVMDIDAFTPGRHKASTAQSVLAWVDKAHEGLKAEFQRVI